MLFRYRARNYPETLNADEQTQWLEHCRTRLVDGDSGHFSFTGFHAEIGQLRTETPVDDQQTRLLDDVAAFGAELESFVQTKAG
jgi:exodeoxyribonuclease-1